MTPPITEPISVLSEGQPTRPPRLGFLGVGWIGLHRLRAVVEDGVAEVAAIADPDPAALEQALDGCPRAAASQSLEELLDQDLDGLVVATPSALHAAECVEALRRGVAVFCQKPLARTAQETRWVLDAVRQADRLLAVDLSYRHVAGVEQLRREVQSGAIGRVFAVDLVFHNAYGPDKPWFYRRELSGGGCLIDLGTHLIDLVLWTFGFPQVHNVTSRLYANGQLLPKPVDDVEDFVVAQFVLEGGAVVRLACSWNLQAGREAVIEMSIYGSEGGLSLANVDGSFYDFTVERFRKTLRETISAPPDAWGGRAITAWARRLARDPRYDPQADHLLDVAEVMEAIYA
jgi:predicted dehydrogenase